MGKHIDKVALQKAIRAKYPDLQFRVRTSDFTDLGRGSAVFVESNEWGMTIGSHDLFKKVDQIARRFGAIALW